MPSTPTVGGRYFVYGGRDTHDFGCRLQQATPEHRPANVPLGCVQVSVAALLGANFPPKRPPRPPPPRHGTACGCTLGVKRCSAAYCSSSDATYVLTASGER